MADLTRSPVHVRNVDCRGRGLYATRDIAAGETVLSEFPLLLVASPEYQSFVCAQCLRRLSSAVVLCPQCKTARFCSELCAQQSQTILGNHSAVICRCMTAVPQPSGLNNEELSQLFFLFHALALKLAATASPGPWGCGTRPSVTPHMPARPSQSSTLPDTLVTYTQKEIVLVPENPRSVSRLFCARSRIRAFISPLTCQGKRPEVWAKKVAAT